MDLSSDEVSAFRTTVAQQVLCAHDIEKEVVTVLHCQIQHRGDFLECLTPQYLPFDCQATPLIITEQNALLAELLFQYLVFSPQVLDNILLMAVNPTRDDEEE